MKQIIFLATLLLTSCAGMEKDWLANKEAMEKEWIHCLMISIPPRTTPTHY